MPFFAYPWVFFFFSLPYISFLFFSPFSPKTIQIEEQEGNEDDKKKRDKTKENGVTGVLLTYE
jgi:hypothetical protein